MTTFSDAIAQFIDTKKLLRTTTYLDYQYRFSVILSAAHRTDLADRDITTFTTQDLHALVCVINDSSVFPGLCENTVGSLVKRVRSLFIWLTDCGVIATNPATQLKYRRTHSRDTLPFNDEEVAALLNQAPRTKSEIRDTTILRFGLDTALRIQEICRLNIGAVTDSRAEVCGKGGKYRIVSFGEITRNFLCEYLKQYRENAHSSDPLFVTSQGRRFLPTSLDDRLRLWAERAGVPNAAFHRLRVTFAVNFILNGGDPLELQNLLGHSGLEMTRHYCKLAYEIRATRNNVRRSVIECICSNQPGCRKCAYVKQQSTIRFHKFRTVSSTNT